MTTLFIRSALPSDLNALHLFENACFSQDRMSRQSIQHALKNKSADILIAEYENQIIGSATLFFRKNSKKARIYSIAIRQDYHGKGIADRLYAAIEKLVLTRGCNELRLEVRTDNPRAIQFYKKNGYTTFRTHPNYYEDGTDAFCMQKPL